MFYIAAQVTAQEPWQTQGGTQKPPRTGHTSRPKSLGRLKLAHVLHRGTRHGPRALADSGRHSKTTSNRAHVTAEEPWQTKAGTCFTSQHASRPKRLGRLKLAHVLHRSTRHGPRALADSGRHSKTTSSKAHVTAQELWQTKAGTCSASRHASRPKSPGRLRAALKNHLEQGTCHGRRALAD